ncbi:uncharacterized protein BP01DRAFT_312700 [Aspergillus saccharolyticus JOP 1030-1]|uniref:Protein efr3 n=1 Tax=Aspergillus saccharolyticus JOP 1030-1 TaxID=1450539 RepID=A0A318ZWW4_9EURO|nr:hypothetical protein BP01DRAFT_312700 [Aspergillus saccharolyticus JOP 1030-1]PYH48590.1 hypothetical protein BP01DRAFT_312700 [Aspergillus saccharolyticus JOP 1030-1]
MESVRQSCRPKHQVLVLKCYPQYQKGVQEVKPNPSELSYLLYYASTRRSKLTKVGAFLEKRAARDVWRRKTGNVQVTLQILTALIEKVPRDLPIYARSVLTILETVLRSHDITIVEDSITTFETFCSHQDAAALAAEPDFATQYREVVRTYASFAEIEASSQANALAPSVPMALRWRNAGLRAIKGVVGSETGLAVDGGESLRITLPIVLENLCKGDEDLVSSLEHLLQESEKADTELAHKRRVSTATVQTVDTANGDPVLASQSAADADRKVELDVRVLALRCLERIVVSGSSRGQIRVTTQLALEFILRKIPTGDTSFTLETQENWATSLMEFIAKWCPVQVRFIIPVTMMQMLLDMKLNDETLDEPFIVIFMIDWLLKSPVNMIGLSVIDILLGLLQHMSYLLSSPGGEKVAEPSAKRREQLSLLQKCIGDLTTHIYYGDQVVDMIRAILTRVKPSTFHDQPSKPSQTDSPGARSQAPSVSDSNSVAFSSDYAKITASRAIKNILLVANSKKAAIAAGAETRNKVGIHVWEGTQWLLQESQNEVRYAYADAFLTWLKLETNQQDLLVNDNSSKTHTLRREMSDIEKPGKRTASMGVSQREKALLVAEHNFLRLLHLTIYDIAHECFAQIPEVRLLHLLLASLVDSLGVNAVRFGLPMVLKLQEDVETVESLQPAAAKVNIGSLVYGYLWAVSEKFNLESTAVGRDIQNEIIKRQKLGLWVDHIRLPPASLENILQSNDGAGNYAGDESQLTPFEGVEELVRCIEDSYNFSLQNATSSPPSSPIRSLTVPALGQAPGSSSPLPNQLLPSIVREQILSAWTRESCLAAAEREKAESMSINGSRAGTLAIRNHFNANPTEGSSHSTTSPKSAQQAAAGLHNSRRMSVPESARVRVPSSSRDSPVHVNELRRVLSINDQEKLRRLSPLRGRLDASNRSVVSSSSESMVSGYSLSEFDGDGISVRHQSRDGLDGNNMVTPKASTSSFSGSQMYYMAHEDIPPVPPIPPSLSATGNLASESQRSLASDRPSTAPGLRGQALVNGKAAASAAPHQSRSLSKHKSRSSTGLAAQAADASDSDARREVTKLLEGFLSPAHAERPGGARSRGGLGRRGISGGIGRPPY